MVRTGTDGGPGIPTSAAPTLVAATAAEEIAMELKKADGRIFLSGMENVDWGGSFFGREDSQARCVTEALACAGFDVTYADVMGLSGAAFKTTMTPDLFVAEMHSEMGMDWKEIMQRVWGMDYSYSAVACNSEKNPEWHTQVHALAEQSIGERQMPLFYMDGEWNLLVGYHEDRSGFVCKAYAGDKAGYQDAATPKGLLGEAWFVSELRPSGEPAERSEAVLRSLHLAVEFWNRPAEKRGERRFGTDAYRVWIEALETNREGVSKHGNAFSYSQVITSRQAAAGYLRSVAGGFGEGAERHLLSAAGRYEGISKDLFRHKDLVMWPWEENWTEANRSAEVALLRASLEHENQAIEDIAAALRG
jgi:hypothetical protein